MRGAERVVDVDVGERGVALGQLRVVLRLALEEADVLDHHDLAVGHVVEVRRERDVDLEQLGQPVRRGPQRELLVAPLRAPEMGEQDQLRRALLAQLVAASAARPGCGRRR